MLFSISLFFLLSFVHDLRCDDLLQVQVVHRHCDRTPTSTRILPNCPINVQHRLGLGSGELTPLGEKQCYLLGKFIRDRYISPSAKFPIHGIDPKFNRGEYSFSSSSVVRCLRSAWAFTRALFPIGHKIDIPPFDYAMPNASQSVPITMVQEHNDHVFLDYDNCPRIMADIVMYFLTKAGLDVLAKYQPEMDIFENATGIEAMTLLDIAWLEDIIVVLKDHELLCAGLVPLVEEIERVFAVFRSHLFSREVVGNMAGGFIMERILGEMSPWAAGGGGKKYVHFSGHDTTVTVVQYATFLLEDYPEFARQPLWGSAMIFELWRNTTTESSGYYVRVHYKLRWDGPVMENLSLKSLGCGERGVCDFDVFSSSLRSKSIPKMEDWCQECSNTEDEKCLAARLRILESEVEQFLQR